MKDNTSEKDTTVVSGTVHNSLNEYSRVKSTLGFLLNGNECKLSLQNKPT